jgi:hypothetical protein
VTSSRTLASRLLCTISPGARADDDDLAEGRAGDQLPVGRDAKLASGANGEVREREVDGARVVLGTHDDLVGAGEDVRAACHGDRAPSGVHGRDREGAGARCLPDDRPVGEVPHRDTAPVERGEALATVLAAIRVPMSTRLIQ